MCEADIGCTIGRRCPETPKYIYIGQSEFIQHRVIDAGGNSWVVNKYVDVRWELPNIAFRSYFFVQRVGATRFDDWVTIEVRIRVK